jgi:uncharacterized protein (TIGR03067 family)
MREIICMALVAALSGCANVSQEAAPINWSQKLIGTWREQSVLDPSGNINPEKALEITPTAFVMRVKAEHGVTGMMRYDGSNWDSENENGVTYFVDRYAYKLETSTIPTRIDLIRLESGKELIASRGILKLDGDTLTICRTNLPDGAYPTDFDVERDDGESSQIFKREKQ